MYFQYAGKKRKHLFYGFYGCSFFISVEKICIIIGVGGFRILVGGQVGGGQIPSRHMTSYWRHVPTRFLINQCQIITFLILKSDIIENSRIELRGIVLAVPSNQIEVTFIIILPFKLVHFLFFSVSLRNWRIRWVEYWGAKGYVGPLSNYWGVCPPPPPPPPHHPPPLFLRLWLSGGKRNFNPDILLTCTFVHSRYEADYNFLTLRKQMLLP